MSLATNIKDFADLLHNIYAQQLSSLEGTDIVSDGVLPLAIPKIVVLQQVCLYAVKSLSSGVLYFLSFQWLRDFSYFPLISPEIGNLSLTHYAPKIVPFGDRSLVLHDTFLSEPFSYLFSFAKNGVSLSPNGFLKIDQLVAGFVNSFFFSLPFSLPHLISLRRLFSQGVAAAAASVFGTIAAHSLLIGGVVYGMRFLIIPYYSLQPLTFLIYIVTIAIVIAEFVKEKRVYLVPLTHYPSLIRIGVLNFIVALCESATVFHDLHHLTLNQQVSYLQLYESQSGFDSFLIHTAYVMTFVLGHALFSLGFCYSVLKLAEKACSITGWTLPQTARGINRGLLVAILTLTFSCFPYYGLDYLFTKSAGFLPEDPAYRNTVFSPTQVRSRNRHFKSRAPATKNSKTPLELDINYFDRGMYLNAPKEEKIASDPSFMGGDLSDPLWGSKKNEKNVSPETAATYDPALTFEELNYRGESAWLMRHERARRLPEEQDSKKESVFQQPKTHFKQLRLNQDNKQARAALKEFSQIGSISEWKEGTRPGETVSFYKDDTSVNPASSSAVFQGLSSKQKTYEENRNKNDSAKSFSGENLSSGKPHTFGEDKRALLKELAFEKEIASNYEKSFTSPFGEESDGTPPDLLPVENIIKKRYRLNPVYRALLQTDIDLFIARQPAYYKITQNQEANLFKKRQLLEKYYNSIRYYSPVENISFTKRHFTPSLQGSKQSFRISDSLSDPSLSKDDGQVTPLVGDRSSDREVVGSLTDRVENQASSTKPSRSFYSKLFSFGPSLIQERDRSENDEMDVTVHNTSPPFTKSFVETIYHQQFKGTLNTVKRFFKLTFDEQQNPSKNRILSYDQLLYKKSNPLYKKSNPLYKKSNPLYKKSNPPAFSQKTPLNDREGNGFDAQKGRWQSHQEKEHPSLHEELYLEKVSPFIEESNSAPIYAGWDDKARRFVITNRFNLIE